MTHLSEAYHSEAKSSVVIFGWKAKPSLRTELSCFRDHPQSVEAAVAFPCLSINEFTNSSNFEFVAVTLKHIDERKDRNLSGPAIATALNRKFAAVGASVAIFLPPICGRRRLQRRADR